MQIEGDIKKAYLTTIRYMTSFSFLKLAYHDFYAIIGFKGETILSM